MRKDQLERISKEKQRYEQEGFIIIGFFGSVAREEETKQSDLDILYELTDKFLSNYHGWDLYYRIHEIQLELESSLGLSVDLANKETLDDIGKYFILKDLVYVS